jgi:hypothetical protein
MAGIVETLQLLTGITEADNSTRNQAEAGIKKLRAEAPQAFFQSLVHLTVTPGGSNHQQVAALILKKFFLDKRAEEEGLWQLSPAEFSSLKDTVLGSIQFTEQMALLKRKAEIICTCYKEI